jgi:carotenoid cleavage dioxygenase-like enzyme
VVNLANGTVRTAAGVPPLFAFHHVNAYEDDKRDVIIMDVCTIADPDNLGNQGQEKLQH